ncbi:MAG: ankyrin repeat domain-containing protein [Acidobacteriia bacterium]|nr:ankyrin repeat domain-containing protein [Terriglobia bacterium]
MRHLNFAGMAAMLVVCLMTTAFAQGRGQKGGFGGASGPDGQLWQAAFDGNLEGVKAALAQGASVNAKGRGGFSALLAASRNGSLEVVRYLVEHGAEVDERNNARDKTPLLAAAFDGHYDIAEYLIEHGANINVQAVNGWTPLHDAAYIGNFQIVKLLVDHGANLSLRNERHETARETAERGQHDAVRRGQTHASPEEYKQTIEYIRSHEK